MGKFLRFLGPTNTAFRDNDGTEWKANGEAVETTAERAKELQEQFPGQFEEVTKDNTAPIIDRKVVSEPVVKPGGEIRYRDKETGAESLTPIERTVTSQEVKE